MKFFEIQIRHILVYGYIYNTGMFEINMWDFDADEYWFRDGRKNTVKAAWQAVYRLARDMDRFNHIFEGFEDEEIFFDEDWE